MRARYQGKVGARQASMRWDVGPGVGLHRGRDNGALPVSRNQAGRRRGRVRLAARSGRAPSPVREATRRRLTPRTLSGTAGAVRIQGPRGRCGRDSRRAIRPRARPPLQPTGRGSGSGTGEGLSDDRRSEDGPRHQGCEFICSDLAIEPASCRSALRAATSMPDCGCSDGSRLRVPGQLRHPSMCCGSH